MRASLAIVLLAGCGESVAPASKPAPSLDADAAPFGSDAALSPTDAALSGSDAASSDSDAAFSGPDVVSEPPFDPGPFVDLGPNDVTILVPVPEAAGSALLSGTDLMDDGTPLVPRALFDRLVNEPAPGSTQNPIVLAETYDRLSVVAVRFDLCDRKLPGTCSSNEDAALRLVLQPFADGRGFDDVGFHAFYSVALAEVPALVKDLRELARLQGVPTSAPLQVSPALAAANAPYRDVLRAMLRRWTGESKLLRLTMNAQPVAFAQVRWVLRGVEKNRGTFVNVAIPGIVASTEEMITAGRTGFEGRPVSNTPPGLAEALDDAKFAAASETRKRELIGVLMTAENPALSGTSTVSCIACHASTHVMHARLTSTGIAPDSIQGRYTSPYDLSVTGKLYDRHASRALGWLGRDALISERVVNDTAQVLVELKARFPH